MGVIGRDAELSAIADRLRDRRLVTLVGPGGIGKTTLARAAATASDGFGEGSILVDLTQVDSAAGVRESVAAQLGYSSFRALIDAPGDHSVLLVLDNCEHVVEEVADVLDELLDACQMPTVLATSRAALELPGEVVVPIGPLGLPPAGAVEGPAVELFLQRARDGGAEVDPSLAVAELCRRLDGVPLAIELAAARTRSMTPEEVLARLAAGLDVLDRPRRRSAARHQSLRAAIKWSYDLMDAEEQALFTRLSVFAGPFSATAAHAVAGEPHTSSARTQDLLDGLVAASMVTATGDGSTTWYRLLETVRAYGRDQLEERGERITIEGRLADHVTERAADIILRGSGTWAADVLVELLAIYGNITTAIRWCLEHDDRPDRSFLLVAVLWGVVHQAHTEEVGELAEAALRKWPDPDHPLRAEAAATASTCRYMLGDNAAAIELAEAELATASERAFAQATLRRAIAQASRAGGDTTGALAWFGAAADTARELGLLAMATESETAQAQILADLGRIDEALAVVHSAHQAATAAGSEVGTTWSSVIEGSVLLRVDPSAAVAVLEQALDDAERIQYDAATGVGLRTLALARLCQDDVRGAARHVLDLLDKLLERGSTYELRMVVDVAAAVLVAADRPAPAADLAATALSLPVVSITASVGHELFPLDPTGGEVLGVRDAILVTRAELGVLVAGGDTTPQPTSLGERVGLFRRAGDYWEIGFDSEVSTVRATKGMADLATLLGQPGREVHCLELVGSAVDERGTGPVIDDEAKRAYERRVRELQQEIDDADDDNDIGRSERARIELDALVDQLTEALGLGGRARSKGGAAERARSAVTQRIRGTIRKIDDVHPRLGRHLHASIRTGTFCAYEPEDPVRWQR